MVKRKSRQQKRRWRADEQAADQRHGNGRKNGNVELATGQQGDDTMMAGRIGIRVHGLVQWSRAGEELESQKQREKKQRQDRPGISIRGGGFFIDRLHLQALFIASCQYSGKNFYVPSLATWRKPRQVSNLLE
jgi:hypothetical protein